MAILTLGYFSLFFQGDFELICLLAVEKVVCCRNFGFHSIQAFKKHLPFLLVHLCSLYVEAQELNKFLWLMKIFPEE